MTSPWSPTRRQRLTDQQRAQLFHDRGGQCWRCTKKLRPGDKWIVEHLIALENGGTNEWTNLDISCETCVPGKNAEDHAKAAKSRHARTYHVVPSSERDKRRGFKGWRKFDGTVVWRGR
jgi:5-methylcytosine-specific restriction protein A